MKPAGMILVVLWQLLDRGRVVGISYCLMAAIVFEFCKSRRENSNNETEKLNFYCMYVFRVLRN